MAVKIRLKRLGKVRVPQYRIVVVDSRKKRDGKVLEEIGIYHPKEDPSYIKVTSERAQYWLGVGAQPSEAVAKILKAVIAEEAPQLVILGKQAIDNDMNATGQMLAALLGWGQATQAGKIEVAADTATVTREVDGGLQTVSIKLPAIVTADLRLNEPRYASLPNLMKAKKKELAEKTAADYGVDVSPRLTIVKTTEPEGRKAGIKVASVDELVSKLKAAGVI